MLQCKVGFFAWTLDALDFHAATQTYHDLATTFKVSPTDIALGITLLLSLRCVGAAIFGAAADIYGRKWPLVVDFILIIVLEACTGACQTYKQFLAARSLFGIAMGGVYGNAAATALEDCHEDVRGLLSGIYQSGYNLGYLLAVLLWKACKGTKYGWRSLFWVCAGLSMLLIIFRIWLPETRAYRIRIDRRDGNHRLGSVISDAKTALRLHWLLLIYLVLLMTGFSFMVRIPLAADSSLPSSNFNSSPMDHKTFTH